MHGRDEQTTDRLAAKARMSAQAAPGIAAARIMHTALRAVAGGWRVAGGGWRLLALLAALRLDGSDSGQAPSGSAPGCLPLRAPPRPVEGVVPALPAVGTRAPS